MQDKTKRVLLAISVISAAVTSYAAPTRTISNLKTAFAGETTAYSKYTQFARAAEKEGRLYEANLFRAAARSEGYHARNHKRVLESFGLTVEPSKYTGKVGTTLQNLQDAVKGESYENTTMYPEFVAIAKSEDAAGAVRSFNYAMSAEKVHERLYAGAIKNMNDKVKMPTTVFYVCPTCGDTFPGTAPGSCPVCGTDKTLMIRVK